MELNKDIFKTMQGDITVKVESDINPKEFFQDREGLMVWDDFKPRILDKAEPTKAGAEFKLMSADFAKNLLDEEIESALPKEHLFSETEVSALVASLISKQPKGEDGMLLNNGYANLFYTPAFVVGVGWGSGSSGWGVGTWLRDHYGWSEGVRVFSPATVS